MRRVCPVDVSGLLAGLHLLDWKPAGDPGTFAMIERWPSALPVQPVFDAVLDNYPGYRRGMTCFSKLTPGQFIEPHFDRHNNDCPIRVHVPITTNPSCVFVEGKTAFYMAAGWAWEINPTIPHCTGNAGAIDRVHLFFNVVQ